MRRIVLPQAMRSLLPGIGNQTISLIKSTSIASVIFVNELTFRAEQIVGPFVTNLPVRARLDASATIGAWLSEFQRAQADAAHHHET